MTAVENPSAFPRTGEGFGNPKYDAAGMTLRDWFAGQAISGAVVAFAEARPGVDVSPAYPQIATPGYGIADAMLAERAKGTPA